MVTYCFYVIVGFKTATFMKRILMSFAIMQALGGKNMSNKVISVIAVINYIEDHLNERLDLEQVAQAVHYSKYHLHRVFSETVGLSIHEYVIRRKLTEAAKQLAFFRYCASCGV